MISTVVQVFERLSMNTTVVSVTKPTIWDYPQPFLWSVICSGEHQDKLGHVNNVEYLLWLQEAGWQHIHHLGYSWDDHQNDGAAMALVNTNVHYLLTAYAGDQLTVGTWITATDRIRIRRAFQIIRHSDQKTLLRAQLDYACISLKTGKARRKPDRLAKAHLWAVKEAGFLSSVDQYS